MLPIDVIAIEQEARRMRAIEMQRMSGQIATRLRNISGLLLDRARAGLTALGSALHLLFSRIQHDAAHKVANSH